MIDKDCDCPATCPQCGYDLFRIERFQFGSAEILYGRLIIWKGKPVDLTTTQVAIVSTLLRARGAQVSQLALLEVVGSEESDDPGALIAVHLSHIRARFRQVDPIFNAIGRGFGSQATGLTWWVEDDPLLPALQKLYPQQRRLHRAMVENPGLTLLEYAELAGYKGGCIHQAMQKLIKKGLAYRKKQYQRPYVAIGTIELHHRLEQSELASGA